MSRTRSGLHDRRGFDGCIKLSLGMVAVSFLLMVLYSWKMLALALFFATVFIVLETISAPPANRPEVFVYWARNQGARRPVLLCLGDSLTHGQIGGSYTPELPTKICETLGMDPPKYGKTFADPFWVVNAGQNGITSHTILTERLNKSLACHPDFISIMIGTNDVLAMSSSAHRKVVMSMNELPEEPSLQVYERNLNGIINHIRQASPNVQIGLCTLPPLTEALNSRPNQLIREANAIIEKVAKSDGEKCSVIPVYARIESILEKKSRRSCLSLALSFPACMIACYLYHFPLFGVMFSWNLLSALFGQHILVDGIHLNENGRDEVVEAMMEWLNEKHVAKAIAVKQF